MRSPRVLDGWGILMCCLPLVAFGHHARFEFDESELVEVRGIVTSVFWRNPHIRFSISTAAKNDAQEEWLVEGSSINRLERLGVTEDMLNTDGEVSVLGFLSRRDERRVLPVYMTLADGRGMVMTLGPAKEFGLVDENAQDNTTIDDQEVRLATRHAEGVFRVWVVSSRSGGTEDLPLTAAARTVKDAWVQPEDRAWRCDPPGMLENMSSPYPMELVDGGDEITLRLEQWDGVRTIHMDRSIDGADPPPTRMGYSVGRWEGRTLIVQSKNFESGAYDDRGTPQSAAMRVVERFTLSEDETRLDWSASVVDLETFTEPVARQNLHFSWVPGEEVKPFNCSAPGQ